MIQYAATIVIPLKRQRDTWLWQCICSAVSQTVLCHVVVVTHSETPDSNLKIIHALQSQYENLTYFTRDSHKQSFPEALNQGWRKDYSGRVGFLLSDDWLESCALERCLESEADIVSTGMIYHDDLGKIFLRNRLDYQTFEKFADLESKANYLKHFFLFSRAKLEEVGGVDEKIGLTGVDDYDLIWTLLEQNASVSVLDQPLYHYRDHNETRLTLRDRKTQAQDLKKVLVKHGVDNTRIEILVEQKSRWFGRTVKEELENMEYMGKVW